MREIQLKEAKARLSAVVDDALRGEEFVITRHGHKQAVVVSWEDMAATVERSELRPPSGGGPPRRREPRRARRDAAPRRGSLTYLVDTSVVSLAPTKAERPTALIAHLKSPGLSFPSSALWNSHKSNSRYFPWSCAAGLNQDDSSLRRLAEEAGNFTALDRRLRLLRLRGPSCPSLNLYHNK